MNINTPESHRAQQKATKPSVKNITKITLQNFKNYTKLQSIYVVLNLIQDRKSERQYDAEINSARRESYWLIATWY